STPVNSTPYLIGLRDFLIKARQWTGRKELIDSLEFMLDSVESLGVKIDFILIGGSFTALSNCAPRDLDAVWLYRVFDINRFEPSKLRDFQACGKTNSLDIRLIPIDADPVIFIKSISFFSVLYSKKEGDMTLSRALILVDCRVASDAE
ncbi:MAG TPA: hypothetical protein VN043_07180, partial [Rhodanobacter sp.]|nr:hypothetical protein [Rhodanobacter sp.]